MKFSNCPVGTLLTDEICQFLQAYHTHKLFDIEIPGRADPRLISAFFVIQSENNKMDVEAAEAIRRQT